MLSIKSDISQSGQTSHLLSFPYNGKQYQFRDPQKFAISLLDFDSEEILSSVLDIATELGHLAAMHDGKNQHLDDMFHRLYGFRTILLDARRNISELPQVIR